MSDGFSDDEIEVMRGVVERRSVGEFGKPLAPACDDILPSQTFSTIERGYPRTHVVRRAVLPT